jgi:hypothetical protein
MVKLISIVFPAQTVVEELLIAEAKNSLTSTGQFIPNPVHFSAGSQVPVDARQIDEPSMKLSAGHAEETPVHNSAKSHKPLEDLHI